MEILIRRARAFMGIPEPRDTPAPSWISAVLVGLLLALSWQVSLALGGAGVVPPHWFYVPIAFASARFGYFGGIPVALAAGILAGPLLPASVDGEVGQHFSDWASRTGFFVAIAAFLAWLVGLYRHAASQLRSSRAVARAMMGTVEFDPMPRSAGRERIRAALKPGALSVVVQPIVHLASGEPVGFEALARFSVEPRRPPNEWFTEAWSVDLGVELEMAALQAAVELLPDLPSGYLSVNLSPATLLSAHFRRSMWTLPRDRLVVEMTEHVPVSDYDALGEALAELRARGVRFAVDDAGAGYASLRHVIRLDPDVIKVDVGLVRGLDENPLLRSVTRALIAFGEDAGAQVVAEGVETQAEARTLRALGANYAQGYLFSAPMPLPELALALSA